MVEGKRFIACQLILGLVNVPMIHYSSYLIIAVCYILSLTLDESSEFQKQAKKRLDAWDESGTDVPRLYTPGKPNEGDKTNTSQQTEQHNT